MVVGAGHARPRSARHPPTPRPADRSAPAPQAATGRRFSWIRWQSGHLVAKTVVENAVVENAVGNQVA